MNIAHLDGNIGLLGGTFDPVHTGHIELARVVEARLKLDAVLFIPAYQNPLKQLKPSCSDQQRIEMLKLAISSDPHFGISTFEVDRGQVSYSVETLRYITAAKKASAKLFLIIGSDNLSSLHRWKEIEQIFDLATIVPVSRAGVNSNDLELCLQHLGTERYLLLKQNMITAPILDISATRLREGLERGLVIPGALNPAVEQYIQVNRLYLAQK